MGARERELRIQPQCPAQLFDRLQITYAIRIAGVETLEEPGVGLGILGRLLFNPKLLRRREAGAKGTRDLLCDLALHRQNAGKVAVVVIGPDGLPRRRIHELDADANAGALDSDAAVHHMAKSQLPHRAPHVVLVRVEPIAAEKAQR